MTYQMTSEQQGIRDAILRHKGVALGKADYCAKMLPFVRQDEPAD